MKIKRSIKEASQIEALRKVLAGRVEWRIAQARGLPVHLMTAEERRQQLRHPTPTIEHQEVPHGCDTRH